MYSEKDFSYAARAAVDSASSRSCSHLVWTISKNFELAILHSESRVSVLLHTCIVSATDDQKRECIDLFPYNALI